MHTKLKINQYLKSFTRSLNKIQFYVDNNDLRNPGMIDIFLKLQIDFESLSELITHQYNYYDYQSAIKLVKNSGYASISRISRSLNLRYNQCFEMILKMERQGLISKPDSKGIRKSLL